jgi:hypothetical protein
MDKDTALDMALEALEMVVVDVKTTPTAYEAHRQAIKAIKQARSAPVQDRSMLECSINPIPLSHPLRDYHTAMLEGPLHYTWTDKPHRLVYDLIAAVKFYADRAAHVQEPVACGYDETTGNCTNSPCCYTTPLVAQRQWVELTDEEIEDIVEECDGVGWDVARAIKAKLKAKNTV